jgi:hypothetical protein
VRTNVINNNSKCLSQPAEGSDRQDLSVISKFLCREHPNSRRAACVLGPASAEK